FVLLRSAFRRHRRPPTRYSPYPRPLQQAKAGGSTRSLGVGRTADADVLLRAIESGAVTKVRPVGILSPSMADRGQAIRGISVFGGQEDRTTTRPNSTPSPLSHTPFPSTKSQH